MKKELEIPKNFPILEWMLIMVGCDRREIEGKGCWELPADRMRCFNCNVYMVAKAEIEKELSLVPESLRPYLRNRLIGGKS